MHPSARWEQRATRSRAGRRSERLGNAGGFPTSEPRELQLCWNPTRVELGCLGNVLFIHRRRPPSVSTGRSTQESPELRLHLPCAAESRGGKVAPSLGLSPPTPAVFLLSSFFSSLFPPLAAAVVVFIAVAHSRRVLATGPCWHSSFPASRDPQRLLATYTEGGTGPLPRRPLAERCGGSP